MMEWLKAIQWDHPAIVAATGTAVGGVFLIAAAILKRNKPPGNDAASITTTANPNITVSPQIDIDTTPTVHVGLNEKAVGQELSKALDPHSSRIEARIDALSEQVAAQLAPKQPLPDSEDPLKIKAVEFFNAGLDAYHEGEIGQAIGHWLDAVALDPDLAEAHSNLGAALKLKGKLDVAIEHWTEALRIDPDYADAHYNLGIALLAKGDFDAAIQRNNAALGIDPDYAGAHFNLGCALAQKKDAAAAVAALAKAIELNSKFRDMAKTDADYDPIRDDPAFRKLIDAE